MKLPVALRRALHEIRLKPERYIGYEVPNPMDRLLECGLAEIVKMPVQQRRVTLLTGPLMLRWEDPETVMENFIVPSKAGWEYRFP